MEFDIGNILYIVITLVAVIVGIMGKKKKPGGKGTGGSEGKTQPGFLENLEKVLNFGQAEQGVVDLQDYEESIAVEESEDPYFAPTPGTSSMMEEYERLREERMENVNLKNTFAESDMQSGTLELINLDEDVEATDYFGIVKDFDARTAVIYSAIINRLDY